MSVAQKTVPLPTILDPPPRGAPPTQAPVPVPAIGHLSGMDDGQLGVLAREGHMAAWEELYQRQHAAMLAYARSLKSSTDEADDLVHDTFLRAWQNRALYDPAYPYHTWLRTILRRLSLSLNRHRNVRRRAHQRHGVRDDASGRWMAATPVLADVQAERADLARKVASVLAMMRPEECVLLEAWAEGARAVDLADEMESTDAVARGLMFRAKKRFAALYIERYGDADAL